MSTHDVFEQYQHLIRPIAVRLARHLPGHSLEDLRQSGSVGLLDACARYRADRSATFAVFARARIRGAILDSLAEAEVHGGVDEMQDSVSGEPSPERFAEIAELEAAVRELPFRQRQILELHYGREMSLRAAARAAGISFAAARRREASALAMLRVRMAA